MIVERSGVLELKWMSRLDRVKDVSLVPMRSRHAYDKSQRHTKEKGKKGGMLDNIAVYALNVLFLFSFSIVAQKYILLHAVCINMDT